MSPSPFCSLQLSNWYIIPVTRRVKGYTRFVEKNIPVTRRVKGYTRFVGKYVPVTRRVKGYTRFVGKYLAGRRKHKKQLFAVDFCELEIEHLPTP